MNRHERIDLMAKEEISYEQSLEMMNEAGLRAECVRLKKELDVIKVQQLTKSMGITEKESTRLRKEYAEKVGTIGGVWE